MHKQTVPGWLVAALVFFSGELFAEPAQLEFFSLATAPESTRLILDLSAPVAPRINRTSKPERLTIRLDKTRLATALKQPPANHPQIGRIRMESVSDGLLVTVVLKRPVTHKYFQGHRKTGLRLVVELSDIKPALDGSGKVNPVTKKPERSGPASLAEAGRRTVRRASVASRELVIAIDAGHGGKDNGAIGPNGTREKDVVLAIARKLEAMIRAEPGMRPVMVRKGDEFIDLRQRAEIARRARADLFISLHADAYVNGEAKGSSVFTLSSHGATSEASRWLARRANSADLVGGVKLRDKDKLLASVLLDLSQTATMADSDRAATRILNELQKNHPLHHHAVQKAGFAVLKSPDIPSLLIETAFISNPDEERNLRSHRHQEKVARSIFYGIRSYCGNQPIMEPGGPKLPNGKTVIAAAQP